MARPSLCILVEKGPKNGHTFRCEPPALATVGRDRSNSLQITKDSGISQRHLCFRYVEDGEGRETSGWVVEDKGSSNGTLLNGSAIEPEKAVAIKTGDIIKIGAQTTIRVEVLLPVLHLDNHDRKTRKPPVHEDQQEEVKRKQHGKKAAAGNKKSSKKPLREIQEAVIAEEAEDKENEEHEEQEEEEAEDKDEEGNRQKQCKKASGNKRETCKDTLLEDVAEDDGKENQMEKGAMKASNDKKKTVSKPKLQEAVTMVEEKQNENRNKKPAKKASGHKKKTKTCDSPLLKVKEVVENHEEDQREKEVKRACVNKKKSYKKPPLEMQDKEEEEVQELAHCEKPILVMHEKSEAKAAAAEEGGGGGGGEEEEAGGDEGRDGGGQGQICGKNDLVDEVGSMTVQAWFDHMMEEGPKYLYRVSESIIQDMKAEAEKFDEYIQSL